MIIIGVLSAAGLLISVYFAFVHHGIIKSDSTLIPSFCRMDQSSCLSILGTREARMFGIPNFHLGILFYLGLLVLAFNPALLSGAANVLKIVSGLTVVAGVFLSYSLLFVIKKNCILCFTAHSINLVLFLLLLFL